MSTGLSGLLAGILANDCQPFEPIRLAGGRAVDRGPGLIELIPDVPGVDRATIISAGIHGNETAPLELMAGLAEALDQGRIPLAAPTLLVIGHPAAIVAGTRYLETNLNRLFGQRPTGDGLEHRRAAVLRDSVDRFWATHGRVADTLHLDLHTAIRESRYPRFVVEPLGGPRTPASLWQAMAAAGLQAVLHQAMPSPTFSRYSRARHGVAAFTVELGRVAVFGANDLTPLAPMSDWLATRIANRPAAEAALERLAFFTADEELIRVSDDFMLCFAENVPNFTVFAPGTVLARDAQAGETVVGPNPVCVVFPNARVERGARAALLARPVGIPG